MQPATVVKWHRTAYRTFWRWKSKPGRPPISAEMQALIRRLSRENPIWSADRIHDTLAQLGYGPPDANTIRRYMARPKRPRDPSPTWLPFLRNHLDVPWAIDLFTVVTLNFRTLHVFVVLEHGRRRVVHAAISYHPSMGWVIQHLRNAMPFGLQPRYLFRDNAGIYGEGVKAFLDRCDIDQVRTAYRSPWQNPYVERFIGTLRRELLDHVIVLGRRHLNRLLKEFIDDYYHTERPHQGLDGDTPIPREKLQVMNGPTNLVATPVLGGCITSTGGSPPELFAVAFALTARSASPPPASPAVARSCSTRPVRPPQLCASAEPAQSRKNASIQWDGVFRWDRGEATSRAVHGYSNTAQPQDSGTYTSGALSARTSAPPHNWAVPSSVPQWH